MRVAAHKILLDLANLIPYVAEMSGHSMSFNTHDISQYQNNDAPSSLRSMPTCNSAHWAGQDDTLSGGAIGYQTHINNPLSGLLVLTVLDLFPVTCLSILDMGLV